MKNEDFTEGGKLRYAEIRIIQSGNWKITSERYWGIEQLLLTENTHTYILKKPVIICVLIEKSIKHEKESNGNLFDFVSKSDAAT